MNLKYKHNIQTHKENVLFVLLKDILITILSLITTTTLCFLLKFIDKDEGLVYFSMLFMLSVFVIARFTNGYIYGILSSFVGALAVNFLFTYPYFKFNFDLSGGMLTMMCMLVVSITTSALITRVKRQGEMKIAVEKEKTRSNLLRAVSHDLRTPLTSISGASSAIIENYSKLSDTEKLKLLSEIKDDSQWLISMVENLLSITRIDQDNHIAEIKKNPELAEEVISEAVTKFKKSFQNQVVNVKVPQKMLIIPMDAILIEQVIINLLENAVQHSQKEVIINLTVKSDNDTSIFEVSDNGCGIDKEILPKIFDGYFKKVYEDLADGKRNMGIGLSVCYTIIKAHNGEMQAKNNNNGGATFIFTLPLNKV